MLKIMKEKEDRVSRLFKDTEEKLARIFKDEFKEFDIVTVKCFSDHDELQLEKEGRRVKFRLASKRNTTRKKLDGGLYFKKFQNSECDFNEKEFKEIQLRIHSLYER